MSKRKRSPDTLREWIRARGGLRYCGDVDAYTRASLGEYRTCSHRRNGQVLVLELLPEVFDPNDSGALALALKHVHADSEEPWERLLNGARAAGLIITCRHCGAVIEQRDGPDDWQDAGSSGLVFCTDQDDTHDDQRHEPTELGA